MLRGVQAQDVMATSLVRIPRTSPCRTPWTATHGYDHSSFPVDEYGRTIGLLTLRKVRRMPSDQWPISRVREHMVPLGGQSWYRRMPPWIRSWPSSRTARPGGARGRRWGGGRDHHAIGSHPVAAPLANARRQSARQQIGPPEPGQAVLKLTVPRITASVDSQPVFGSPDRAIVRQLYLLVPGAFSELASWARVTRNARCADASLDADQWFPVTSRQTALDKRQPLRSPSARPAWCTPSAWPSRCGTGISASMVSGAAWSQPNERPCAAGHRRASPAGRPAFQPRPGS